MGVVACTGRMGRFLCEEIILHEQSILSGGTVKEDDELLGCDIGSILGKDPNGIYTSNSHEQLFKDSDVVIDFSTTNLSLDSAMYAAKHGKNLVIGTTGFSEQQLYKIKQFSQKSTIIWSGNMSQGVNILSSLVEQVTKILDSSFDVEIIEFHHNKKVDAPSGTALMLGEAAARGRNVALKDYECKSRDGIIGQRPQGEIGFSTVRAGDIVGEHIVIIAGDGERIEITHKASSRKIFAKGALRAAFWSINKANGFFSMQDVLSDV